MRTKLATGCHCTYMDLIPKNWIWEDAWHDMTETVHNKLEKRVRKSKMNPDTYVFATAPTITSFFSMELFPIRSIILQITVLFEMSHHSSLSGFHGTVQTVPPWIDIIKLFLIVKSEWHAELYAIRNSPWESFRSINVSFCWGLVFRNIFVLKKCELVFGSPLQMLFESHRVSIHLL